MAGFKGQSGENGLNGTPFLDEVFGQQDANRKKLNQDLRQCKGNFVLNAEKDGIGFFDYVERACSHCVGLPKDLSYQNFEAWVMENSNHDRPAFFRLYIEKGFDEEELVRVKKMITDNFQGEVFITEIYNVPASDIEKIDTFVMTFFADQQVRI